MSETPSTPPARQRTNRNQFSQYSFPNYQAGSSSSTIKTPLHTQKGLLTPSTITKKSVKTPVIDNGLVNFCKRPVTTTTTTNKVFSLSPTTPQRSPCKYTASSTHRKRNLNDIFSDSATSTYSRSTEKISFGLFLPLPSTVGSGRKIGKLHGGFLSGTSNIPLFDKKKLESLRDEVDIEEEIEMEVMIKEKVDIEPSTPGKQIIDDETVRQWHGKSFNDKFFDDEEEENNDDDDNENNNDEDGEKVRTMSYLETKKIPRASLINPFIENENEKDANLGNNKQDLPSRIDYNTHMELVNNKTGERKVLKLTKNQMKYKPKKLSFEGI
ncbi:hypothetical protein KGF56_004671 [Candida oxycetoniae]|uniref:Uncharacterized protein n=1 Tax=Candida oxycetoniae TaxID=497107 RepID=A0AAI9SU70_9ASCO|nr:uncharacterized protein KGF56_004671 [Candida oxycetoniae]KAI3402579.2 hypothetical protein KGF56_004671 [Candida oxycetoniae]